MDGKLSPKDAAPVELEPSQREQDASAPAIDGSRVGRFLLYWITTTSISTSTSYTTTYSISSVLCTIAGQNLCGQTNNHQMCISCPVYLNHIILFCKEYKRYSTKLRIYEKSLFNPFTLVSKLIRRFVVASTIESVVITVTNCLETLQKEETNPRYILIVGIHLCTVFHTEYNWYFSIIVA